MTHDFMLNRGDKQAKIYTNEQIAPQTPEEENKFRERDTFCSVLRFKNNFMRR